MAGNRKPTLTAKQLAELDAAVDAVDREEKNAAMAWALDARNRHDAVNQVIRALRGIRKQAGRTLDDVGAESGIGKSNLSRLENHRVPDPTLDTILRYAQAVGMEMHISLTPAPRSRRSKNAA